MLWEWTIIGGESSGVFAFVDISTEGAVVCFNCYIALNFLSKKRMEVHWAFWGQRPELQRNRRGSHNLRSARLSEPIRQGENHLITD